VLTADTYTSVLLDLHFKTAEAVADSSSPPPPTTQPDTVAILVPTRRRPQRPSHPHVQNLYGPGDPEVAEAAHRPHPRDTQTTPKDQEDIDR